MHTGSCRASSGDPAFAALARVVYQHRRRLLVAYSLLLLCAVAIGTPVLSLLKAGGFEDPGRESWQVYALMQREFGVATGDVIALYETASGTVDDASVMKAILSVVETLAQDPDVGTVISVYATGSAQLVSRDRTRTILIVNLRGDEQRKTDAYRRLRPSFAAPGVRVHFAGLIPTNIAVFETIRRDLARAEALAFPLTAILCLFIFESGASLALLLITGLCGVTFAFAALRCIVYVHDVSVFAVNTINLLGLGLAIDYALFLVSRFREELRSHGSSTAHVEQALVTTMSTTGRAVAYSGITIAASLLGLFAFPHMFLRSLALGGIVVVLGTVVLALTLVPAALGVLGPRIDALSIRRRRTQGVGEDDNLWGRTARAAMARPVPVALLVTAALLCLAAPFARFNGSIADYRILSAAGDAEGVRHANEILDSQFLPHQSTPHMVLVTVRGDALSRANLEALGRLSDRMAAIAGVAHVDGVFTAVAGAPRAQVIDVLAETGAARNFLSLPLLHAYVKGSWMRFSVLSRNSFEDGMSTAQVFALRALSTPDMKVEVAGYSAALVDLRSAIAERAPYMVLAVVLATFLVLFLMLGSVTLPFKAMLMNALSLTASFGAIVWVFQDGRFAPVLGYVPLGISDTTQPIVMFAIVFGLSMDYEIFILARIREEYLKSRDNAAAIATGLARTGRLITSAAAVLVVVIGAFSTSEVLFMKTLGVGMALAIILDATVVRALLVPALMRLMGKWNWYAPRSLVRLWRRLGMSDERT